MWVWWVLIAIGAALVTGSTSAGLEAAKRRGERYEPRHLAGPGGDFPPRQVFYGSMTLAGERLWRTENDALDEFDQRIRFPGEWDDPVPWEDLQSDARIEDGPDWREQTAADLAPEALHHDPGPGAVPSHGCPPGPVQGPPIREDDQGRVVRAGAPNPRPAARADLTGSLSPRQPEKDPGQAAHAWPGPSRLADTGEIEAASLGPRARAVLERYERCHRERWAVA